VIAPADKALLQKPGVVTVTLNAPESYGIEAGQPLILHGVQVGQVLERKLSADGVILGRHRSAIQRPGTWRQ
jgi:paraquat-inducible protein B